MGCATVGSIAVCAIHNADKPIGGGSAAWTYKLWLNRLERTAGHDFGDTVSCG